MNFLGIWFLLATTDEIKAWSTVLKSISLGSPFLLSNPLECSFNPRWDGVPASAMWPRQKCHAWISGTAYELNNQSAFPADPQWHQPSSPEPPAFQYTPVGRLAGQSVFYYTAFCFSDSADNNPARCVRPWDMRWHYEPSDGHVQSVSQYEKSVSLDGSRLLWLPVHP